MRALAFLLMVGMASAQEISEADILATIRHMKAIAAEQAQALVTAQTAVTEKEKEAQTAAAERNAQALRADMAESTVDTLKLKNSDLSSENLKLKALLGLAGLAVTFLTWRLVRK